MVSVLATLGALTLLASAVALIDKLIHVKNLGEEDSVLGFSTFHSRDVVDKSQQGKMENWRKLSNLGEPPGILEAFAVRAQIPTGYRQQTCNE